MREAFAVIQPDRARRKKEEEDKKARTTYRDDIYLRQKQKVRYGNLYNPFSDNEGVEYDPKKDETIFEDKKVSKSSETQLKRKALNAANTKRQKLSNKDVLPDDPNNPFATLKISSQHGKQLLADLSDKHNTQINVWMILNDVDKANSNDGDNNDDGNREKKPDVPENQVTPIYQWATRSLRNGKVLQPTTPRIRRRKRDEPDMHGVVSADWRPIEEQYKDRCAKRRRLERDEHAEETEEIEEVKEVEELTEREIFASLGKPIPVLMPADLKKSKPPVLSNPMDWQSNTSSRSEIRNDVRRVQGPTLIFDGATRDTAIQIDSASEAENNYKGKVIRREFLPKPILLPRQPDSRPRPQQPSDGDNDSNDISKGKIDNNKLEEEAIISEITTSFANPINFQYIGPNCDFCKDYRFPIFGYGRKQVTIARKAEDPDVMMELGNGHSTTRPPNKMCFLCSGQRLMIMRCKNHDFESIPLPTTTTTTTSSLSSANTTSTDVNREDLEAQYITHLFDWDEVRDDFDSPIDNTIFSSLPPFLYPCSLCANPATHTCRTWQSYTRKLQPCLIPIFGSDPNTPLQYIKPQHPDKDIQAANPIKGCNLRLCQGCHAGSKKVNFKFEVLEDVVQAAGLGDENDESRRADLGLLFKDGELGSMYREIEDLLGGREK